ncbi:MAG: hypothetical protein ACHRXM_01705 [Isosphaerales bacterium]
MRERDGDAITNEPDPDKLAADLNVDNPADRFLQRPNAALARGSSCLPAVFKGFGLMVVGFGVVVMTINLVLTVFSAGRNGGKVEAIATTGGFLVVWVGFGAVWLVVIGKIFPGPERYWRLDLGDHGWVLRQGHSRRVLGRVSPQEIEGLALDRRGRVVAETCAGKRRRITGPMAPFESAWAVHALSGLLGQSPGAGRIADSTIYACVPTLDPAASPASTLRHRLSRVDRPWGAAMGCLAVNVFWNGITWLFVWVQFNRMDPRMEGWKGWLFLAPFILIGAGGLALLVMALLQAFNDTRAGATIVEVSMNPLEPGEPCKVFVSSPGQSALTAMVVRLVCVEEVKYRTRDRESPFATESKRVRELEVYHGDGLPSVAGLPFETTFEFEVPADSMHSL